MIRDGGAGHKAIMAATEKMLRDFASPVSGLPRQGAAVPRCDKTILGWLSSRIMVWNTDAGNDEILAGKEFTFFRPLRGMCAPSYRHLSL